MKTIQRVTEPRKNRPIRVLQFGEGNFLRAFVDYMLDVANEQGVFDGNIAIIKPTPFGSLDRFKTQDNLYTVVLRGKENGRVVNDRRIVTSVSEVLHCRQDYNRFMELASLESLRFLVSNTTEAGIVFDPKDHYEGLPDTYPGKLTKFLYARYQAVKGDREKGLILLPVELIEDNGEKLRECVLDLCRVWHLPDGFCRWVEEANLFCNTLVDRIVTGFPSAEADTLFEEFGYRDDLADVGEPFALWVIEDKGRVAKELPLDTVGLPVVFTDDLRPYRERKVRVLNGAHTASVLAGYLYGIDIVRDCMQDEIMGRFIRRAVLEEIVPQVKLPREEVVAFAESVFERFENPFIDHSLLAISLNSVSKWKTRVLPSLENYYKTAGHLPPLLTFSFAALLAFYTGDSLQFDGIHSRRNGGEEYLVRDDRKVLEFFAEQNRKPEEEYVRAVASEKSFWGVDLTEFSQFTETVTHWLKALRKDPAEAIRTVLEK